MGDVENFFVTIEEWLFRNSVSFFDIWVCWPDMNWGWWSRMNKLENCKQYNDSNNKNKIKDREKEKERWVQSSQWINFAKGFNWYFYWH